MKDQRNQLMKSLLKLAQEAAQRAYAPYSGIKVGAALLTEEGKTFTGCNIENASYSLAVCAEGVALYKAVSSGSTKFKELFVYAEGCESFSPCGACRQAFYEFSPDMQISFYWAGKLESYSIRELLLNAFKLEE
jgi:cytidine deaminase